MKYYEKRRHLLTKIIIGILAGTALFFAICDCAPKAKQNEVVITFKRD